MVKRTVKEERKPFAATEPRPPDLANPGEESQPEKGDHIFGDVLGTIRGGLENVFGETDLKERMQAYDNRLLTIFNEMKDLDLGHKDDTFIIGRAHNKAEKDQQDYRFGYYSDVFEWRLCRCVSAGFIAEKEVRIMLAREARPLWEVNVIAAYEDLMTSLVDKDALGFFLSNHRTRDLAESSSTHTTLSLSEVSTQLKDPSAHDIPSAKIREILENFIQLKIKFTKILNIIREQTPRKYDPDNKVWLHY